MLVHLLGLQDISDQSLDEYVEKKVQEYKDNLWSDYLSKPITESFKRKKWDEKAHKEEKIRQSSTLEKISLTKPMEFADVQDIEPCILDTDTFADYGIFAHQNNKDMITIDGETMRSILLKEMPKDLPYVDAWYSLTEKRAQYMQEEIKKWIHFDIIFASFYDIFNENDHDYHIACDILTDTRKYGPQLKERRNLHNNL